MADLFKELSGKLLDLSLRNKLINFKDLKYRSLEILSSDYDKLFDIILKNEHFKVISLSEKLIDNSNDVKSKNLFVYKKDIKVDNVLRSLKKSNDLSKTEKGVNTFYIAYSFITWKEESFSSDYLSSPLLLISVNLTYDRKNQCYCVDKNDDEIIVNPTLKLKLNNDFGIVLPIFDEEDTLDLYLEKVNDVIKKHPDWSLSKKAYIGIFSFAKIAMYEDFKNHKKEFTNDLLIKTIYTDENLLEDNDISTDYKTFFKYHNDVKSLHNVVDADSSQIEAIIESNNNKSFVIQGPPGTGKSQTITNIIAEALFNNKKVLFVSEKKAALDVVYNNLKKVGLDDFCLQIHSDKMNKVEFIHELYRVCLNSKNKKSINSNSELKILLNDLRQIDDYNDALNSNVLALNIKVIDLINGYYKYDSSINLNYKIDNIKSKDLSHLGKCKNVLDEYALFEDNLLDKNTSIWFGFKSELYSYETYNKIEELLKICLEYLNNLFSKKDYFKDAFNKDYLTYQSFINEKDIFECISDLPFDDLALINLNTRNEITSLVKEIYNCYSILKDNNDYISNYFENSFCNIDCKSYFTKFKNQYSNIFNRLFNSNYKIDKKSICAYAKKDIGNVSYKIISSSLEKLIENDTLKEKIIGLINNLSLKTKYNYNLSNYEETAKIFNKLESFNKNHFSFNLCIDYIDIRQLIKEGKETYNLISNGSDNFNNLTSYFDKKQINYFELSIEDIIRRFNNCFDSMEKLNEWVNFSTTLKELKELKLLPFIDEALTNNVIKNELSKLYEHIFYKEWLSYLIFKNSILNAFKTTSYAKTINEFKTFDKKLLKLNQLIIKNHLIDNLNGYFEVDKENYVSMFAYINECKILLNELNKKRKIKPIRQMFREIPHLLYIIKPCMLMSPISAATYLTYKNNMFDLVIFDEASQLFPCDTIGSIARSKNAIIVGDSKQMPPTDFFMSSDNDDYYNEEEYEENASDFESILDLASSKLPYKMLNWHYRSRTESLIAFSNHYLYNDKLVTFPSSKKDDDDRGIKFFYVKNGTFTNRQNIEEAKTVLKLIYKNLKEHPERSLGVVCFSIAQQNALEDIVEEKCRKDKSFSNMLETNTNEPFFIKNLETVQGDERDTIIFSIGYGKDYYGNLKHNFGPLNKKGGERRLNVAITRAKYNIEVVSSIRSIDIDLNRANSEGVKLLKNYLDLAENGQNFLDTISITSNDEKSNSNFIKSVANFLINLGYKVDENVGCSGYKIDLAIKHPDSQDYVLAIECDGKSYQEVKNTRDRDRLRQEVLERLGWNVYRLYTIDWLKNNKDAKERLVDAINKAMEAYKEKENSPKNETICIDINDDKITEEISDKNFKNDRNSLTKSFFDRLDDNQKDLIKKLNDQLKYSIDNVIVSDKEAYIANKFEEEIKKGNKTCSFYISKKPNNILSIRFKDLFNIDNYVDLDINNENDIKTVYEFIIKNYKDRISFILRNNEPDPYNETNSIEYNDFIKHLSLALMGKKYTCDDLAEANTINDVCDTVFKEIGYDAISRHYFKDIDDFNKHKYTRNKICSLFNIDIDFSNLPDRKVKQIYYYFIAMKILNEIIKRQQLLNVDIVTNKTAFINSLYQNILNHRLVISDCIGINSNFSLVSEDSLIDIIKNYLRFINDNPNDNG